MRNEKLTKVFSSPYFLDKKTALINNTINQIISYRNNIKPYSNPKTERYELNTYKQEKPPMKYSKIKLRKITQLNPTSPVHHVQKSKEKRELPSIFNSDFSKKNNKINTLKKLSGLANFKTISKEINNQIKKENLKNKDFTKINKSNFVFSFDNNLSSNATNDNSATPFTYSKTRQSFSYNSATNCYSNSESNPKASKKFILELTKENKFYSTNNNSKIVPKIIKTLEEKIDAIKPKLNNIVTPYEKTDFTLKKLKDKCYVFDDTFGIIMDDETKESKININCSNEIGEKFIKYLFDQYFDCFEELAYNASGKHYRPKTGNLFQNFVMKKRQSTKKISNSLGLGNLGELNVYNKFYMDKFILMENYYIYRTNKNQKDENNDFSNKKRKGIKRYSTFKSNLSSHNKLNSIKHQITMRKLNDFSLLKNKKTFQRNLKNIEYNFLLNILKGKNKTSNGKRYSLLMINEKDKLSNKEYINYQSKLFYQLVTYIQNLNEKDFITTFHENKALINVNQTDDNMNTLLIYATKANAIKICQLLLENECDPNIQNNYGNTAFHYAVSYKNFEIINLLVQFKASEHIKNNFKRTPWECSNTNPEEEV